MCGVHYSALIEDGLTLNFSANYLASNLDTLQQHLKLFGDDYYLLCLGENLHAFHTCLFTKHG